MSGLLLCLLAHLWVVASFTVSTPRCSCRELSRFGLVSSGSSARMAMQSGSGGGDGEGGAHVNYKRFYDAAMQRVGRVVDLQPYDFPEHLHLKEADVLGKGKQKTHVRTSIEAFSAPPKLRQIRAAMVKSDGPIQVLNFVIFPDLAYDLPIFGADIVSLPGKTGNHLICIDLQPPMELHDGYAPSRNVLHSDVVDFAVNDYAKRNFGKLESVRDHFLQQLPWGGDLPDKAKRFFSPFILWSRVESAQVVETAAFDALLAYLDVYLELVATAQPVTDPIVQEAIVQGHLAYSHYRKVNDPARGMLTRFYGAEWTEEAISGILFDLEEKLERGECALSKGTAEEKG